jgi:hypothetical protein
MECAAYESRQRPLEHGYAAHLLESKPIGFIQKSAGWNFMSIVPILYLQPFVYRGGALRFTR